MKNLIISLILFLSVIPVHADEDFYQPYRDYMNGNDPAAFLRAYDYYSNLPQNNDQGNMILAFLHLSEVNNRVDHLLARIDSLNNHQKFNLANLMLGLSRFEESIEIYDMLNENSPKWSCPWRHKGEAYLLAGRLQESEQALLQAIEVQEDHFDAYVMLAEVQLEMERCRDALATMEKGLQYRENVPEAEKDEVSDAEVDFLQLRILSECGDPDDYLEMKTRLEEMYPASPEWEKIE